MASKSIDINDFELVRATRNISIKPGDAFLIAKNEMDTRGKALIDAGAIEVVKVAATAQKKGSK